MDDHSRDAVMGMAGNMVDSLPTKYHENASSTELVIISLHTASAFYTEFCINFIIISLYHCCFYYVTI